MIGSAKAKVFKKLSRYGGQYQVFLSFMREIIEFLTLAAIYRKREKIGTIPANFYIEHKP